jgi:hypothetical protein
MSPLHTYFEPIIRRQGVKNRIAAVVILAICGGVALSVSSLDLTEHASARMVALTMLAAPVALAILGWTFLPDRGLAALANPSQIVWYYGVNQGAHVNAVMVGYEDGKLRRYQLPLISMKKGFSQEAFPLLQAGAPHATTGFSEERREAFKKNPASLRS